MIYFTNRVFLNQGATNSAPADCFFLFVGRPHTIAGGIPFYFFQAGVHSSQPIISRTS
jgi:hypothetical protein